MRSSVTSARATRRLTIVSQFFDPDPSATAYFVSDIAYGLVKLGWDVRVITAQPSYTPGLPPSPSHEVKEGVAIRRLALRGYTRTRLAQRLAAQLAFTWAVARELALDAPPDVVMAVTCPPFLTWLAPAVRARGIKFVALIHDVYPEVVSVLGKAPGALAAAWAGVERLALGRSDIVIALGECQKQVLQAKLATGRVPVIAIPHWAKESVAGAEPVPRAGHPLLTALGIEGKFVIQYSGNLGLFHGLEILPEVIAGLSPEVFHVLVVGGGQMRDWLSREVEARGLRHVTFLPHQPEADLAVTLTACDVALVCLDPRAVGLCVPSKIYGSLAVGRAVCVVAPSHAEPARTVIEHDCGRVAEYDAPKVVSVLNAMANDRAGTAAMGVRGRAGYAKSYRRDLALARYASALEGALSHP
jgi:colanic acid biosynthesis glycosyl transferase WcaI